MLALLACFTTPTVLLATPGNVPIPTVESAATLSAHDRMRVGLRYAMGDGVAADDLMAQQWFALSAKDGYAPAQVALASMKAFESDVQDVPGAIVLLRGAAARDNVQAQSELARLLSSSSNPAEVEEAKVWQDKAEAITRNQQLTWAWRQAAKGAEKWAVPAGSVADGKRLAQHVDSPDSKNLTLDIGAIGRAVEAGDNAARTVGAMVLATGNGIKADEKLAVEWLREAAKAGYAPAQAVLGQLYKVGWGAFAKDDKAALEWMKLAAEGGNSDALSQLIGMLPKDGPSELREKAKAQLESAAAANDGEALMKLGFERLAADQREQALGYFSKAADYGDEHVLSVLGMLCGWGTAPVGHESAKMTEVRRYAQREDAEAQLMLGLFYAEGWGTPPDETASLAWYDKAIAKGNRAAILPKALMLAGTGKAKEADKALLHLMKEKAFAFLHETDLVKLMFEETDAASEITEMNKGDEACRAFRREKITRQLAFLSQHAKAGNPVASYLYGSVVAMGLVPDMTVENGQAMRDAALSKLCTLSSQDLAEECATAAEGQAK